MEITTITRSVHKTDQYQTDETANISQGLNSNTINPGSNFPVGVLPLQVRQIIKATNENLNFPVDFIGAAMLYATSVAIGNTHRVELKEGWMESAVLYLALIGRAGTNKSHPLSFALKPLVEHDRNTYLIYQERKQEYEQTMLLSRKERQAQCISDPVKPVWEKFLLSDFTPEGLAEVHKHNERGIGVYVDELAGWFKNFNRYSKGSEMEFWLSAWSGKPINIDRKTGEPVFIQLPFISVTGTIQNGILAELAKDNRTQNGFIERILFAIPENLQKPYWNQTDIDPAIIGDWQAIVDKLINLSIHRMVSLKPTPIILRFTPEAKKILFDWQKANTDESNHPKNEAVSGIYSKLEVYAIRFALIIEMLRFACNESSKDAISPESVKGALELVKYFKNAAIKVNSIISNADPLDRYSTDKKSVYQALPNTFTTKIGVHIANKEGIAERTFKTFLKDKELFVRTIRGEYEKLI